MKLKLYSDFHDFYDFMFGREGKPFVRFSEDDLTKRNQFSLLEAARFQTPVNNYLYKLVNYTYEPEKYVVYTNPISHRGEGKVVLARKEVLLKTISGNYEPLLNCYASVFIKTDDEFPRTHRILNIGNRQFRINYTSDDSWRSNCGNVKVEFDGEITGNLKIPSPLEGRGLWAIDFVNIFAVDLNTSPGLKGTGIEDILSATEVLDLLREFYNKFEE